MCAKLRGSGGGWCEKMCEIKRVGALRGRQRVDCEKMCEIKRVGALRGGRRVDCAKLRGSGGGCAKKFAKLRGLGH